MSTKKIVFLAHDPGGYDVVYLVFEAIQQTSIPLEFYCIGPAAKLNDAYATPKEEALEKIENIIANQQLLGLVTGRSWGTDIELHAISRCKKANIPTILILDYWSNYALEFNNSPNICAYPDYYIVMDELAKKEAISEGVPSNILYALGHPGLDRFVNYKRIKHQKSNSKRKALFLSQPLSQLYGQSLGYTERSVLEDYILALQSKKNWSLYVKFHPKDDMSFKQRYIDRSVQGNLIEILPEFDLIIGMNTIGLLHAVLMDLPTVSYQPNLRQADMCITNKLGLTKLLTSYEELLVYFNGLCKEQNKEQNNVIKNLQQKFIWFDGHSTERVSRFIREVFLHEN
ncbi:MAG: hypothetical protein A4E55_00657 [Pelotomaculum sp. PtaU1.Bin035]|nr:MAG: hypothetical protein A4E55_00657 [Pelotomaculum sp. PtaU1.Bin035]